MLCGFFWILSALSVVKEWAGGCVFFTRSKTTQRSKKHPVVPGEAKASLPRGGRNRGFSPGKKWMLYGTENQFLLTLVPIILHTTGVSFISGLLVYCAPFYMDKAKLIRTCECGNSQIECAQHSFLHGLSEADPCSSHILNALLKL